jgi:hypothetical protein
LEYKRDKTMTFFIKAFSSITLILIFMASCATGSAANADPEELARNEITLVFDQYWKAVNSGDFLSATTLMYPPELDSFGAVLLPYMESIIAEFPDVDGEAFATISESLRRGRGNEIESSLIFAAFLEIAFSASPELKLMMENAEPEVIDIAFRSQTEGIVFYEMNIMGTRLESEERFILYEGAWYLRMNQDPTVIQSMLNQGQ